MAAKLTRLTHKIAIQ